MKKNNTYPSTMTIEETEEIPKVFYKIHGYQESRDGEIECLTFYLLSPNDNAAYGYSPSDKKVHLMWPNADHFPNKNFHIRISTMLSKYLIKTYLLLKQI